MILPSQGGGIPRRAARAVAFPPCGDPCHCSFRAVKAYAGGQHAPAAARAAALTARRSPDRRPRERERQQHVDIAPVLRHRQKDALEFHEILGHMKHRKAAPITHLAVLGHRDEMRESRGADETRKFLVDPFAREVAADDEHLLGAEKPVAEAQGIALNVEQPQPAQEPRDGQRIEVLGRPGSSPAPG